MKLNRKLEKRTKDWLSEMINDKSINELDVTLIDSWNTFIEAFLGTPFEDEDISTISIAALHFDHKLRFDKMWAEKKTKERINISAKQSIAEILYSISKGYLIAIKPYLKNY
jgi:hypothetical protein